MAHYWDSGMLTRTPAWHKLGNVLPDWPGSFEEARAAAGLTWDVDTRKVYVADGVETIGGIHFNEIEGWQALSRSDNGKVLSIQPDTYAVIGNGEFGNIIEYVLEHYGDRLKYETLLSLKEGRQIVATMYLDEPIQLPNDSVTLPYLAFISRHDGQGGMRIAPTSVRIVCANTLSMAEKQMDGHKFGFTIRHTANWADRVNAAKTQITLAMASFKGYEALGYDLLGKSFTQDEVNDFLDKWLPYSTDLTDRQRINVTQKRNAFSKVLYGSHTNEGIEGTRWGAFQAAIEVCDHYTSVHSDENLVLRQLTRTDSKKAQALALLAR